MASHRRILDDHKSVYLCSTCNVTAPTPPSLPPPPPPSPVDDSSNHRLRLVFVAVAVFSAFLLLSLTYFAVLRRRRRYGGAFLSARASSGGSPPSDAGEAAGSAFDEAEEPLHPIWFIRTVGLDEAAIDKIDVAEYKAGDGLLAGATGDCSVCLGEFSDGELIRLLPKCGHAFHLPCIDTWLRAHVNCPLCRANIVDSTGVAPHPTGTSAVGSPADVDMPSSVPVDSSPIGIQASDQEQSRTADADTVIDIVAPANPIELPDSAAESSVTRSQNEQEEGLLLPVRRSASMDSPFLEAVVVRLEPRGSFDSVATEESKHGDIAEQSIRRSRRKQGNNSKGSLDRNAQLEIERSLSSSARGFFCRHSRMSRDSSLPL